MSERGATSRSATLVSVDVLGFSRDTDEGRAALARALDLVTLRLETAADRHEGQVLRRGEDGFILAFDRPDQAIAAADEIAKGPRPPVRGGVHQGPISVAADGVIAGGETVDSVDAIQKSAAPGVVLVSDTVKRAVKAAATDAGLPGVSAHILRHTAAVWMIQAGVPIKAVADYLGDTVQTVEKHYAKHSPEWLRQGGEALRLFPPPVALETQEQM